MPALTPPLAMAIRASLGATARLERTKAARPPSAQTEAAPCAGQATIKMLQATHRHHANSTEPALQDTMPAGRRQHRQTGNARSATGASSRRRLRLQAEAVRRGKPAAWERDMCQPAVGRKM